MFVPTVVVRSRTGWIRSGTNEQELKFVRGSLASDWETWATVPVGAGVLELKIDYGPGYRVYFGQVGMKLVILLCGGDKSSQAEDIRRAIEYWGDYKK
jgi:putative addiction module killer protein